MRILRPVLKFVQCGNYYYRNRDAGNTEFCLGISLRCVNNESCAGCRATPLPRRSQGRIPRHQHQAVDANCFFTIRLPGASRICALKWGKLVGARWSATEQSNAAALLFGAQGDQGRDFLPRRQDRYHCGRSRMSSDAGRLPWEALSLKSGGNGLRPAGLPRPAPVVGGR